MTDTVAPCPPEPAVDGPGTALDGDGIQCKRCGHINPPLDRCEQCRSMLKGNRLATGHGLRSLQLPRELVHLRDEIAVYEAGCLADEGGAADVPVRHRSLLLSRARVERRIRQLDDALELKGLIDRRGRLRVAWLQQLQGLISTAVRLDTLLGLERRAKHVDLARAFAEEDRRRG